MVHNMNLQEPSFSEIIDGKKNLELRLYDEKRKTINIGDTIVFCRAPQKDVKVEVVVTGLIRYRTFEEMFKDIDYTMAGPCESLERQLKDVEEFYPVENQKKLTVLGIRFEKK